MFSGVCSKYENCDSVSCFVKRLNRRQSTDCNLAIYHVLNLVSLSMFIVIFCGWIFSLHKSSFVWFLSIPFLVLPNEILPNQLYDLLFVSEQPVTFLATINAKIIRKIHHFAL